MFEITNSIVQLIKGLDELINRFKRKPIEKIAERFVNVFESHGVHRNQIPSYFGRGITLQAVNDIELLAQTITSEHLKAASSIFGVNCAWLEFASGIVYEVPSFYKYPDQFSDFVAQLKNSASQLECYVLRTFESEKFDDDSDAAFLFVETIAEINKQPVVRYHPVGHNRIGYWKSRADFAANCGLLIKHNVNQIGKYAHKEWLEKLNQGTVVPKYDFQYGETVVAMSAIWYIDEFFENPQIFLRGVAAERNNFGLKSAILRWLKWSGMGYFDSFDDDSHPECRARFQRVLEELQ